MPTVEVQGIKNGNPGRWKVTAGTVAEAQRRAEANGIEVLRTAILPDQLPAPAPPPEPEPEVEYETEPSLADYAAEAELMELRRDVEQLRAVAGRPAPVMAAPARSGGNLVKVGIVLMAISLPLFCVGGVGAVPFGLGLILLIVGLCI